MDCGSGSYKTPKASELEGTQTSIKTEAVDENILDATLENPDEAAEDIGEQAEGIFADEEDVDYYCDEGFKIKQVSPPVIVQRTLKDLYALSVTPYLKLDPEYQRDVVWDENRASGLIASAIQGYFIPPIIFNVVSQYENHRDGSNRKEERFYRICVDGKQRLTSVQKFMEGQIGVLDSCNPPKKWYFSHPIVNGVERVSNHNILPASTKEFFRTRTFCCYEYKDLAASVEENMFQLVQRGVPLTPAERMRALSTNWAMFAKQYEADYPMVVNLSKQTGASGFRSVMTIFAQILEVMHHSGSRRTNRDGVRRSPTLQASPQVLTRLLLDDQSLSEGVKAKFKEVFDNFQRLVDLSISRKTTAKLGYKMIPNSAFDSSPDYLQKPGVEHVRTFSPLELVATATLLLVRSGSRTMETLIEDVKEMRVYLRKAHKDLRLNPQCWASVWLFIETDLTVQRGGKEATAGVVATVTAPTTPKSVTVGQASSDGFPISQNPVTPIARQLLMNGNGGGEESSKKRKMDM